MDVYSATQKRTVLLITIATAITIGSITIYKNWKRGKIPSKWYRIGTVTKLHIYPMKSGRKRELQTAEVTNLGLREVNNYQNFPQLADRILVLYGVKDNRYRSGKTHPKLVLLEVSAHDENHFAINAPNMETLLVKIPNRKDNKIVNIKCLKDEVIQGIDCGDEAEVWMSKFLTGDNFGTRLAYNDANKKRDLRKVQKEILDYYKNLGNHSTGLFSAITSVSLLNQKSVEDLNQRIEGSSVVAENFRHNIIIDDTGLQPYDEDNWDWIKIGNVVFRNVKDCTRCIFTTVDQETGIRNRNREPLRTLEKYRKHPGPEDTPRIGSLLDVRRTGVISVGDDVYITRKA